MKGTSTPRRKALPRSSSSLFVLSWFLKKLTWLQMISMVLRCASAAETTSLLLTWLLLCTEYISSYRKSLQKWLHKLQHLQELSRPMTTTIMTPSTPSTMTRTITMRANCTSEHNSTPLVVLPVFLMMCHNPFWLKFIESFISRHPHVAHVSFLLISLRPLFLLPPVHLRLLPLLCPDVP